MAEPFILAFWELPPDSSIARTGEAIFRCSANSANGPQELIGRVALIRQGFSILFLREQNSGDEASWTPLGEGASSASSPILTPQTEWPQEVEFSNFGRVVWFENAMAILNANGRGTWRLIVAPNDEETPFRWHDGARDWSQTPAREWKTALERELDNPASDASFALRWAAMDDEERGLQLIICRDAPASELKRFLRLWLHALPNLPDEDHFLLTVEVYGEEESVLLIESYRSEGERFFPVDLTRDGQLQGWLERTLTPRRNRALEDKHECATEHPHVTVSRTGLSQHEQMEARLELRDWARGKVPDELLLSLRENF